jgi:dsRNA-specific ribonuclease
MRIFTVGVYLFGKLLGTGRGYSRQSGEQDAAEKAMQSFGYFQGRSNRQ